MSQVTLLLCVLTVWTSVESAPTKKEKRSLTYAAGAALPLVGGCQYISALSQIFIDTFLDALYRKWKTGSFAPPKLNIGAEGSVGVGPVSVGGKVGFGVGGYPEEGDTPYYQQLTAGDNGAVVGGALGVGVGDTTVNGGAGVAANLEDGYELPSVPEFVTNIPGHIASIPSYLSALPYPSWPSLPWGDDTEYVEYDSNDTDGWYSVSEQDTVPDDGPGILGLKVPWVF